MLGAPPLAADVEGVVGFATTVEADAVTSRRFWRRHRLEPYCLQLERIRVIAVFDHLDEERDRVPAAIERFARAGFKAVRVSLKSSEALLPPPALQARAGLGLQRFQNFSEVGFKLACLLPITEEERLFHNGSKLALGKA